MLKILWIEDELGGKKIEWFDDRPVTVISNFDDAKAAINSDIEKFDLVVLDINLEMSERSDNIRELANEYGLDETEFLKESGMTLFLNLLEKGFPKDRIVFLTANSDKEADLLDKLQNGLERKDFDCVDSVLAEIQKGLGEVQVKECQKFIEDNNIDQLIAWLKEYFNSVNQGTVQNTYNRFCEAYKRCRIKPPKPINKSLNNVKNDLIQWLNRHEDNQYLVLRRGIIEGCEYLKRLPKENQRFKDFIKENEKKPDEEGLIDYLDVLANFFPLREATNKEALYKLFIRTLAHEWEAADPEFPSKNRKLNNESQNAVNLDEELKYNGRYAFSWILKMVRNWSSHNSNAIFNKLTEQDVAYLFICNMRAIFDLGDKPAAYENQLLVLFNNNSAKIEEADLIIKEKGVPLIKYYVDYFNQDTKSNKVHSILNDLQNDKEKLKVKGDLYFITGLYHAFWYLTSELREQKDRAKPNNNNPNQVYISRFYTMNCFDYSQTEFLLKLASHIYYRSFP